MTKRIERDFLTGDVLDLAPALLGMQIVRSDATGNLRSFTITETEAYRGEEDLALSPGIWIENSGISLPHEATPRIGIDYAGPVWKNKPWRFVAISC